MLPCLYFTFCSFNHFFPQSECTHLEVLWIVDFNGSHEYLLSFFRINVFFICFVTLKFIIVHFPICDQTLMNFMMDSVLHPFFGVQELTRFHTKKHVSLLGHQMTYDVNISLANKNTGKSFQTK